MSTVEENRATVEEQEGQEEPGEDEGELLAAEASLTDGTIKKKKSFFGGRTSNSILLMCVGCLLFPICLVVIGWNEQRTLCEQRLILEVDKNSVVADCDDAESVFGKLAFFSCPINMNLTTSYSPQSFNMVDLGEAFRFKGIAAAQRIEMFQCIETAEMKDSNEDDASLLAEAGHNLTGSFAENRRARLARASDEKVYRYKMAWSEKWYDSKLFKATPEQETVRGCPDIVYNGSVNYNPLPPDRGDGQRAPLGHETEHASQVVAGAFTVEDTTAMQQIYADTPINFQQYKNIFTLDSSTDNIVAGISTRTLAVHDDKPEYLSSCATDRLGCVRISYNQSNVSHISVMAMIGSSGTTHGWPMTSYWGCGEQSFIRMKPGEMTKDEFLESLKQGNKALTWSLRVVFVLLCWFTMWCCFEPIASAADAVAEVLVYIPGFGKSITRFFDGVQVAVLCLVSCSIGLSCGLLVIAIVWIALSPVVGGPLLAGSVTLLLVGWLAPGMTKKDPNRTTLASKGAKLATDYGTTQ